MARQPLAVKYRPKNFEDMTEQSAIKDILTNQINTKTFQHGYLFTGPAGTGKTTSARIFANMINQGEGNPIEVDAASNSGVDNMDKNTKIDYIILEILLMMLKRNHWIVNIRYSLLMNVIAYLMGLGKLY